MRALQLMAAVVALGGCGGGDGRTVLIVYSPHGKDMLEHYERTFEQAYPAADVQWVDMGSQEILDRLRAEAANPQADVWFGAPAEAFSKGAKEGLLAAYRPTWAAATPADAHDPRDLWYGTYYTPEVIAYNTAAVSATDAPKDWDDVLDAKWRGKVIIRDPVASGSMRAIFGGIIARSIAQTGSPEAGYEWLRRLDANTKEYALNPTVLYQKLGRQEGLISLYNMPDIATLRERFNIPVTYVIPASGTPMLVDAIAGVRGSKRPELARQYIEFVTTREALLDAARRFGRIPVRNDIPADSLPDWIRDALGKIRPMPGDARMIADSLDVWMTYWDTRIRNRGRRGR
jgi:iron(III) transport system substrate-binding protein